MPVNPIKNETQEQFMCRCVGKDGYTQDPPTICTCYNKWDELKTKKDMADEKNIKET